MTIAYPMTTSTIQRVDAPRAARTIKALSTTTGQIKGVITVASLSCCLFLSSAVVTHDNQGRWSPCRASLCEAKTAWNGRSSSAFEATALVNRRASECE